MRVLTVALLPVAILAVFGCSKPQAPEARIIPHTLEKHGDLRIDNYDWLQERDNPEVLAYLEAENAYLEKTMKHTEDLQETLFEEIKGRIRQNDESVPYLEDGYYYYTRYEQGKEYAVHCRKKGSLDAAEEILLDANELAEGDSYLAVRSVKPSSGGDRIAFAVDTVGRRFYTIRFKDLATGRMLPDEIPQATPKIAWALDNQTLFYARQDPGTLRPYRIYRHTLGSNVREDPLVYEETDDTFECGIQRSKSREYLLIASTQTLSTEVRYLDARDPFGEFKVILPREADHEYSVDHLAGGFFIRTNWQAPNFRLMKAPVSHPSKENWREIVPHRDDVFLAGFELFRDHLVLSERQNGLDRLRILSPDGEEQHTIAFDDAAYHATIDTNRDLDTHTLRYAYSSLLTPLSIYDYDMDRREQTLRKQDEVLGDFDPRDYRTERLFAPARDGAKIPISIVYPKDLPKDGSRPLLLYAYGSYGISSFANFSPSRLSLLERGFAYAIAHVRGGQEMGRHWYEDGKLLHKKNSFFDFIDCAKFLCEQGYTSHERLFARGGSAGGLLTGAVLNMAPELFKGVVSNVAFVDVITTMLDETIPLTTAEYDEWGNPNEKPYYDYMLSYSPYDQVKAQDYPNMLMTTGLHDSQVQYWEPAKWVAKLRALKTDDNLLLLKTNMKAGHGGESGRFRRYRGTALAYAFMLDLVGIRE